MYMQCNVGAIRIVRHVLHAKKENIFGILMVIVFVEPTYSQPMKRINEGGITINLTPKCYV